MRARPRGERRAHLPAQPDDEHERPDHRQERRRELHVVPRADAREPEENAGSRLPDHVRRERGRGDRGGARADRRGERADPDDRRATEEAERERDAECALRERAQLGLRSHSRWLMWFATATPSWLSRREKIDTVRTASTKRPRPLGCEEAPLKHDEQEREGGRQPAEEEDLDDVRAGLLRTRHFDRADELGFTGGVAVDEAASFDVASIAGSGARGPRARMRATAASRRAGSGARRGA